MSKPNGLSPINQKLLSNLYDLVKSRVELQLHERLFKNHGLVSIDKKSFETSICSVGKEAEGIFELFNQTVGRKNVIRMANDIIFSRVFDTRYDDYLKKDKDPITGLTAKPLIDNLYILVDKVNFAKLPSGIFGTSEGSGKVPSSTPRRTGNHNLVNEITFVEKKSLKGFDYRLYVNGDISDTVKLRKDSHRVRKLVDMCKGDKDMPFRKDILDYINSNKYCVIYRSGKYGVTEILERLGDSLGFTHHVHVEVIDDTTYKKRFNANTKLNLA